MHRSGVQSGPPSAEAVVQGIESLILDGTLAAGDKLPSERALSAEYGISRPVVREGLRRLQERGLIAAQPGRGSFVRALEPTRGVASVEQMARRGEISVRELVTARAMLESETASLAAVNRTEEHIARMRALLGAFETSDEIATTAELDVAFHEAISIASGNTVLQIMFGSIRDFTQAMVLRSLTDRASRAVGLPLHHTILTAIVDQDSDRAGAVMKQHILGAVEHYGSDIDRPLSSVLMSRTSHAPEIADLLYEVSSNLTHSGHPST